jgi:hypothetical protein
MEMGMLTNVPPGLGAIPWLLTFCDLSAMLK